jgi:hypothetical protein
VEQPSRVLFSRFDIGGGLDKLSKIRGISVGI